jgi:DNA-binding NarL/FixJ family response regulator
MPHDGRARVVVADDHRLLLERVVQTLAREFSVVGTVSDGEQLVAAEAALHPDVVVADVCMPRMSGLEAVACIRRRGSHVAVVCLTADAETEMIECAWDAGVLGYVTKASLAVDLVPAVHAALEGRRFVSPLPGTPPLR